MRFSFSFLLRGFRVGDLEPQQRSRTTDVQQSFRALGVSARDRSSARRARHLDAFPIQELVLPDALAGHDVLAKSPTGSGKTLAFGLALIERAQPARRRPRRSCSCPRASSPRRSRRSSSARRAPGGLRVAAVYGGVPIGAQAKRARGAHILIATPGRLQDLFDRAPRLARPDPASSSSTRPTGCSTWASSPRSTRSSAACRRPPDDALLGDARRRGRRARPRVHAQPVALRGGLCRAPKTTARSSTASSPVTADGKVDRLVEELETDRGLALVFVRTKRGADRLVQKLARRGRPRQSRCTAT